MRICKSVKALEAYVPGEQPKSGNVVKLNTNENPYPPSPRCSKILSSFDLDRLRRYPDPEFVELRDELAKLNDTKRENIFVGNGSDEVLAIAAKAFVENDEKIASLDPSYSLYKTLAAIRDVEWLGSPLKSRSVKTDKRTALFLWTNPNAPTGTFAKPSTISAFAKKFPGVVIVDEAYADFAEENCMALATKHGNQNLLVMRTLSKSYSLAGLRVGYIVGPKDLIDAMYKVKDSYNVDAIAQSLALAAVRDQVWMRRNVRKVIKTRAALVKALRVRGWDVPESQSNFVFAKPAKISAEKLFTELKAREIYVRYFPGPLTGDRLRITIGTDAQMKTLIKAIDKIVK